MYSRLYICNRYNLKYMLYIVTYIYILGEPGSAPAAADLQSHQAQQAAQQAHQAAQQQASKRLWLYTIHL